MRQDPQGHRGPNRRRSRLARAEEAESALALAGIVRARCRCPRQGGWQPAERSCGKTEGRALPRPAASARRTRRAAAEAWNLIKDDPAFSAERKAKAKTKYLDALDEDPKTLDEFKAELKAAEMEVHNQNQNHRWPRP